MRLGGTQYKTLTLTLKFTVVRDFIIHVNSIIPLELSEFDFGFSFTSAVFSKRVGEENQQCSDSETLSSRANGHWSR